MSGFTGVDVDFEDMVDKLYKIESKQAEQLLEWYSDWEIRREAFSQVRESLVNMQTALTALNSTDKFLVKGGSSSNESIVGATVSSEAVPGSYSVDVHQLASSSVWSISTGLASKDAEVNNSNATGTFTYTYKGETRTLNVPTGTTLEGLKNLINNDGENLGVRVQLIQSGDEVVFQLSGLDTGASATLEITNTDKLNGLALGQVAKWDPAADNDLTSFVTYGSRTEAINTTETPKTFVFDVTREDGSGGYTYESYTVKLAAGGSLDDLVAGINAQTADSNVKAEVVTNGNGTYSLHIFSVDGSGQPVANNDIITVGGGNLKGYTTMLDATNWQTQQGQNAEVRVNGWPATGWLEVSSNSISDVVDGVTFNVRAEGKATVTVELDTTAIEENVQKFVDAVNEFRSLISELTKVEEDSAIDPDYAENQAEMQMGSALTGNYGIQLLSSNLKQAVATGAKGFTYAQEIEGKMYGDLFNSLSQIGIITDTDESSPTFGLLVINQTVEKDGVAYVQSEGTFTLKEALAKDATAVAKLFSANHEAKSNSSDFAVSSMVNTITEPGNYDVSYTVDASGNITQAYINGKEAKVDGSTISLVRNTQSTNSNAATITSNGTADRDVEVNVTHEATKASTTISTELANRTDSINDTGAEIDFTYEFNGVTRTVEVDPNSTLDGLANTINKDSTNPGVVASIMATDDDPPKYNLVLTAKDTGLTAGITTSATGGALAGVSTTTELGQNAQYSYRDVTNDANSAWTTVDSTSNTLTLPTGEIITVNGAGTATLKAQKHNDADGIVIDIYNLTPGETIEGSISVRQGKINEILGMLEGSEGILGSSGTLAILEKNYDTIMGNIKDKIKKEDERLEKWLRTTKLRFSRLETVLANYQNLQTSIESQISQLSSNKS